MTNRIMITGGAGFIGSAVARLIIGKTNNSLLVVDKLTYASNPAALAEIERDGRYSFLKADIGDLAAMKDALETFKPDAILNLAAESHVDRSIDGPEEFIQTNVVGTFVLLQAALDYWHGCAAEIKNRFRFVHVSTDEVFGSLNTEDYFDETTAYDPSSPYAASKAAADHLVSAWYCTYGLPAIITNCSNNYGPWQFPEKLIPVMIINGLEGRELPVYGQGLNVRDWLHVEDHACALMRVLQHGVPGESYCIGGNEQRSNIEVVRLVCNLLDEFSPKSFLHKELITFVEDRPGHDMRYAINAAKATRELQWRAQENFESGLRRTVLWYLENRDWWQSILGDPYRRLGLAAISQ